MQQATEYLRQHRFKVRLWHLKEKAIASVFQTERRLENLVALFQRMAIFEILDFAGKAAIILAAYSYFSGAEDRQKQSNYQAWQVINSAVGQRHSGGREDALEDLNKNNVSLTGINLKNANIPEVNLKGANLGSANLEGASLWSANLAGVKFFDVFEFQKLTPEQLKESCFWDKGITVLDLDAQAMEDIPIDVAVIEKAMAESPYDVAACTEFWDERKAEEAESEE